MDILDKDDFMIGVQFGSKYVCHFQHVVGNKLVCMFQIHNLLLKPIQYPGQINNNCKKSK